MKVAVEKSGGRTLFKNQNRGASLLEMACAVGLIAMIALPAIKYLGNELQGIFSSIDAGFDGVSIGESTGGSGNEGDTRPGDVVALVQTAINSGTCPMCNKQLPDGYADQLGAVQSILPYASGFDQDKGLVSIYDRHPIGDFWLNKVSIAPLTNEYNSNPSSFQINDGAIYYDGNIKAKKGYCNFCGAIMKESGEIEIIDTVPPGEIIVDTGSSEEIDTEPPGEMEPRGEIEIDTGPFGVIEPPGEMEPLGEIEIDTVPLGVIEPPGEMEPLGELEITGPFGEIEIDTGPFREIGRPPPDNIIDDIWP